MNLLEFLMQNWDSVLVVIGFIVLCLVLIKRGETATLNKILFALVTQAEKELGGGTGKLKLSTVVDALYQRIPAILKFLFTEKELEQMVEDARAAAKKLWGSNEALSEYVDKQ